MAGIIKKALVTGGSGFIGGHLIELLEKNGFRTAIYDFKKPHQFTFKGKFFFGDILEKSNLEEAVKKFNPGVIYDCCGVLGTEETFEHVQKTVDVNIKGTVNVLEVIKQTKTPLIYLSLTNNWLNPYTITKRAATSFCLAYAREYKLKIAVLKALNVFGPRQLWIKVRKYGPTFIIRALENKPLIVNGSGKQIVDAIYVKDVCQIMIKMYESQTCWGKEMDGGTGVPMTVNEVAMKIIRLADSKSKIKHIKMRRGEPENAVSLADPAPVKQFLNYYPETSFEQGMQTTIKWYRQHKND